MHSLSRAPARGSGVIVAVAAAAVVIALAACGGSAPRKRTSAAPAGDVQHGLASWYGGRHHGGPTASGERFDKRAMTAAHRTFKMNTRVRVTNKKNGRSVVLRINDRGPFVRGRIIDVSEAAAEKLGMKKAGVVPVKVERLR